MTKPTAGHITGTLSLTIDGAAPIDIGNVTLPLVVTHVYDSGYAAFGLGVNLEAVRDTVAAIFWQAETGSVDGENNE